MIPDSPLPFPAAALTASANDVPSDWKSRSLSECTAQFTAFFAIQRELLRTEAAWLAGVPYWDAKQAISRHVLEAAHHAEALLKRLHELKATSAEHRQVAGIDELIRDIASASDADDWLRGLYTVVKPWLIAQFEGYLRASDPVMDQPSHVVLRRIINDVREQVAWFEKYTPQYSPWGGGDSRIWCDYLRQKLAAASFVKGALIGKGGVEDPLGRPKFTGIARVRRDSTFNVANKSSLPREGTTFAEKRFLVFYNHLQEMQFAESLCAILYETTEMPWAFHHDLARHIADEVRHASMGQTRLEQLGVRLTEVPMLTQHYEFRSNMDSLERFCLMTLVMEATAFERKRANVILFDENRDRVSALYESYDIKDEMMHTNLGHVWVPIMLRVYHDSRSVAELTEHCRALIAQVITEYPANAANMIKK